MITRDTPWREIGIVDWDIWHQTITNAGGPAQLAARESWIAANPHSALALAMLKQESSYGTDFDANPATNRNPWNLKLPAVGGYVPYATWADGALGWRSRITSPTYKDGIYARTRSIADLIYVYAPPFDQTKTTTENYIAEIVRLMNGWMDGVSPPPEPPAGSLVFGRVPEPPYIDMIVHKDRPGQGYDVCPPRHNIGFVPHETQGDPAGEGVVELQWYRDFFSCPNGERCSNALVDWCCARNGQAARYNDPNGTREPWASGGSPNPNDPTGFNTRFGSAKRNEILESCEFVKTTDARLTAAQIAWGAARAAYIADQDEQLWSEYPRPAKHGGVHMMPMHWQLSQTSCNQHPDDMAAMITTAKSIMRQWQVVEDGGTTPAPTPTTPPPSEYAEPIPVPELAELADADPNTVAAFVTDEGTAYIYVNDRVRAIRDTPRLQRANPGAARVGRHIRKGQEFTVAWMLTAKDGRQYYLTPAFTRVLVRDTERIADSG
jgi:hypothetical protein